MSNPENGWRVAIGPDAWVTVATPEEAVKLGGYIASLVAGYGVEKAERERLDAENKRLRKAGDEMADTLNSTYTKEVKEANLRDWLAAKEGSDAK